jgi:polysaccharide biosynthesis protein PslH
LRILICASSPPFPPMDGFHLLLDELMRGLQRSHDVRLVAQLPQGEGPQDTTDPNLRLAPFRRRGRLHAAVSAPGTVLRSRPLSDDRRVASLWPAVEKELAVFSPDVVHVTPGRLAAMGPRLKGWPTVLGAVDARHLNVAAKAEAATGMMRLGLREQARRIRRLIATEYDRFGHVTVVTEEDRDALLSIVPTLRVTAIPNGVDTLTFRPDPNIDRKPGRIVFTGTMNYAPNVTAAHFLATEVYPSLQERHPEAELVLAGRHPSSSVRQLARNPTITVTGEVPDIRPWLVGSHVFVAPMSSGTGIKNKLLEAMACGVPCVASPRALQGISVQSGRQVLIAEGLAATVEAVDRVLTQPELADVLGREGRRYVESKHSWSRVAADHETLYDHVRRAEGRRGLAGKGPNGRAAKAS